MDAQIELPDFDGETYDRDVDRERLTTLLERVRAYMSDGMWHTLPELYGALSLEPTAAVSARLRDLRKARFGGYVVESRRAAGGLWEYRVQEVE